MAKKRYHHGALRAALIDAGAELAATYGPDGVSLREVAKKAGVSHAAPYHHFSGKADLLNAVALEGVRRMDAEMRKEIARKKYRKPQDRLHALGLAYIRFAARNPNYFKAIFRGVTPNKGAADAGEIANRNFARLIEAVQSCFSETGPPSRYALDRILTAWALVHGIASLWVERAFDNTPFEKMGIEALSKSMMQASRQIFAKTKPRYRRHA